MGLHCCTRAFSRWRVGVTPRCGGRASHCGGLSHCRVRALEHRLSRCTGLVALGIWNLFLHQGLNLCPLHWQADFQPLNHEGSPLINFYWLRRPRILVSSNFRTESRTQLQGHNESLVWFGPLLRVQLPRLRMKRRWKWSRFISLRTVLSWSEALPWGSTRSLSNLKKKCFSKCIPWSTCNGRVKYRFLR